MSNDGHPPERPNVPPPPAMTDRALLEDFGRVLRNVSDNLGAVGQNVAVLMEDRPILHSRLAGVEGRMARMESPSVPPLTSERVREAIAEHTSQADLTRAAADAVVIAKNNERDRRIEETHSLATNAATKEDVAKLAESTATKAEVKDIANKQTTDIVTSLEGLAGRNKTVRNLLLALAALAFLAINAATVHLMRAPAPIPQPTQIQVTK